MGHGLLLDLVEVGLEVANGGQPALGIGAAEAVDEAIYEEVGDPEIVAGGRAVISDSADAHTFDVEDVGAGVVSDETGRREGIDKFVAGHWDLLMMLGKGHDDAKDEWGEDKEDEDRVADEEHG